MQVVTKLYVRNGFPAPLRVRASHKERNFAIHKRLRGESGRRQRPKSRDGRNGQAFIRPEEIAEPARQSVSPLERLLNRWGKALAL